jgi:type IV secretory pathway VirB2 component (pilin)
MSDQTLPGTGRLVDARASLPWLVSAGVYALLMALAPRLLADPDVYSHIAVGRWVLEHYTVPSGDPFSLTMRGEHWVAFEWLSQVLYALALDFGGWPAVVALAAAAVALAFGLLTRFLLREWQPVPVMIAVIAALMLVSPHTVARPHVFALPVMVVWIAVLIRANDTGRAPPWALLPLMTLWANLHGSFTFGLAMLGPIACEALWQARHSDWRRVLVQWGAFTLLAFGAACINPYGPEMILVTFRTVALGEALTVITEWQPQNFSKLGAFELLMLAGIGLALFRGITLPPFRIIMLLGVLHLSLAQSRHAYLLGLLAPIFLAQPLARNIRELASDRPAATASSWTPALAGLAMLAVTGVVAARADLAPPAQITPVKALKAIETAKAERIFNDYDFGAYLDFVGIPPFIDGRTELYGTAYTMRYSRALNLQNLPDFLRLLDEYRIGATLLTPSTPATALMDRLPEWQRIYADDVAVVHVRRAGGAAQSR